MSNDEFKIKMDIDSDDSIIYVKIPHETIRRAVAGIMAGIVGFLGVIGLRVELNTIHTEPPATEVQQ